MFNYYYRKNKNNEFDLKNKIENYKFFDKKTKENNKKIKRKEIKLKLLLLSLRKSKS